MDTDEFEDSDYSPAHMANRGTKPGLDAGDGTAAHVFRIGLDMAGLRLDQALAKVFPAQSRSRLAALIKAGDVAVDGHPANPKLRVNGGEQIHLTLTPRAEETAFQPEPVPLNVVHEDKSFVVIDKSPGLVVHPAAGNWSGTVLNGMLHRYPETNVVPRAGIVHRLDKDTSGLMVIARTVEAQLNLVRQLQARTVKRVYLALARGEVPDKGTIDAPIGRHPRDRLKMAVLNTSDQAKPAVTHYRAVERFEHHTLVECRLETGRTHQIRVHMASIGFPLEGDAVYGKGERGLPVAYRAAVAAFGRQALHAAELAFAHPETSRTVGVESHLPPDFESLIEAVAGE